MAFQSVQVLGFNSCNDQFNRGVVLPVIVMEKKSNARNLRSASIPSLNDDDAMIPLSQVEIIITRKLQEALSHFETRLFTKLDKILEKVDAIETRIDDIQVEQIRVTTDIEKIKDIIVDQQRLIEKHEADRRLPNLIISGLNESPVTFNGHELTDDVAKIRFLCKEVSPSVRDEDISFCVRLGKRNADRPRIVKVGFNHIPMRNQLLFSQLTFRRNDNLTNTLGKIFVNPDSTVLVRLEEKRLREALSDLRKTAKPDDKIYIKKGELIMNSSVVDKVNIRNQLF